MKLKFYRGVVFILCALMFVLPSCGSDSSETGSKASSSAIFFVTPSAAKPSATPTASPTATPTTAPTPAATVSIPSSDDAFVKIVDFVPSAVIELKYSTTQNFTGQVIYDFTDAYARYGTVKKLAAAADALALKGYRIKIWDAFRPVSAQFKLWDVYPDPTYVANPNVGYSNHTRGCAIDLTLIDSSGNEIFMPTAFDDFSGAADRDYSDVSAEAANNARMLEEIMESCGFSGYYGEWWHFNDTVKYSPETSFEPSKLY